MIEISQAWLIHSDDLHLNTDLSHEHPFLAKLTNLSPFIRFPIFMVAFVIFPQYPRILGFSMLGFNFLFMLVTVSSLDDIEFRVTYLIEEICLVIYSIVLVINISDDMNPFFGLTWFWVFSIVYLLCYLMIMLLEFYVAFHTIIETLNSYCEEKSIQKSVVYIQEGFDKDNKPVKSEDKRGVHYESIIMSKLPSSKGSDGGEHRLKIKMRK